MGKIGETEEAGESKEDKGVNYYLLHLFLFEGIKYSLARLKLLKLQSLIFNFQFLQGSPKSKNSHPGEGSSRMRFL